jgi:hypothetical protein
MTTFRLFVSSCLIALGAYGFFWLKAEHRPQDAIAQAETFVFLLKSEKYGEAYDLTLKNELTGNTLADFETVAKRQFCSTDKTTTTFPLQSNGNRLRRWYQGRIVDPSEVTVEFAGACLFGVTLHSLSPGNWKVYFFQSHAG